MEDSPYTNVRHRLQRIVGRPVSDKDLERLIAQGDVTLEANDDDLELTAQLLRSWWAADDRVRASVPKQKVVPSLDPRYEAVAEIRAIEGAERWDVKEWRERTLPDGKPIPIGRLGQFLDQHQHTEGHEIKVIGTAYGADAAFRGPETRYPVSALRTAVLQLFYTDKNGSVRETPAQGPLAELALIAEELAARYGWTESDAATFVLTGKTPTVGPGIITTLAGGRIRVEIEPAASTQDLLGAIEAVRNAPGARRRRRIGRKTAALALAAAQRRNKTWRECREAWNTTHPEWEYRTEWEFSRDANKALSRLDGR
jgi:hypothetical protein